MAFVLCTPATTGTTQRLSSFPLSSMPSTSTLPSTASLSNRLHKKSIVLVSNLLAVPCVSRPFISKERRAMIAKASADVDGTDRDGSEPSYESDEKNVSVENLPLESKLQLKLESEDEDEVGKED